MAWPVSLPDPLLRGYSFSFRQPTITTQMDGGPPRKARTATAYESIISLRFSMDQTQYAVFQTFYDGEANAGADWVDIPISTGGVITNHKCRFMAISVTFETLDIINVVCSVEIEDRILV